MSKGTPGPWMQHEDYPRVIVSVAEPTESLLALDMTDGNEDSPVAVIYSEADARLMAAAPELLKALEAANRILWMAESYADSGGSGGPERRDYVEVAAEVRDAIAKARGTK